MLRPQPYGTPLGYVGAETVRGVQRHGEGGAESGCVFLNWLKIQWSTFSDETLLLSSGSRAYGPYEGLRAHWQHHS